MIAFMSAAGSPDGDTPDFVKEPEPFVSVASPGFRPVLNTITPFVPVAPWWMCAMLIGVPAGKPVKFTTKVAVPPVMLLFASRVTSNVIVAVPLPEPSESVTGGFSFAGRMSAVNVGFVGEAAVGELLLLQPATAN